MSASAAKRPNVVFLVSEDNSIHYLKLYGYGASTPNVEALSKDGLTFNHAFSNSPVCSVARSTLATAMLASSATSAKTVPAMNGQCSG